MDTTIIPTSDGQSTEVTSDKEKEQVLEQSNDRDEGIENPGSSCEITRKEYDSISPTSGNKLSEVDSNKDKEQFSEKNNDIDKSRQNVYLSCDIIRKDSGNISQSANEELSETNSNKDKEQPLEKSNEADGRTDSSDSAFEITRKSSNISPSTGEEEDAVLGGVDSAKEFDVNLDEDELLKDTDIDDCKNENSGLAKITCDATQLEDIEGTSLHSKHIESVPNVPQCSNNEERDEDSIIENDLCNTTVCDTEEARNDNDKNKSSDLSSGIVKDKIIVVMNHPDNEVRKSPDEENAIQATNTSTTETLFSNKNNENSNNSEDQSKADAGGFNNETKFLHVDQDTSRPDESYETIDTGGEDPFAQTCDEVMDTSESSEKDPDSEKVETLPSSTIININEMSSGSIVKTTVSEVNESECELVSESTAKESTQVDVVGKSNEDVNLCNKISVMSQIEDNNGVESQNNSNFVKSIDVSDLCSKSSTSQTETNISNVNNNDADLPRNSEKGEDKTESNKNDDLNISTLLDSADKVPVQETSTDSNKNANDLHFLVLLDSSDKVSVQETSKVSLISPKPKTGKSNKKVRKSSSEEDSDESDFEISTQSIQRPKRNAAKKAESQIKVVRQFEEAADQEDCDTNAVQEIPDNDEPEEIQTCYTCKKVNKCKINILSYGQTNYFCDDACFGIFRDGPILKPGESTEIVPSSTVIKEIRSANIQPTERVAFVRKCSQCCSVVKSDNEKSLSWETMDFCSEECLGKYQQELGSHCANCKGNVQPVSLGKYCVRFGYEVKQFCCSTCLEEFKKGLKVCSFCQKDISSGAEGFLAPVGDKGTFKDFCTQGCMEKYEQMSSNQPPPPQTHPCHVCNNIKLVEVEVFFESKVYKLCSDICFTAYKFANKLSVDRCDMCKTYFDKDANGEKFNIFYDEIPHNFCCKTCMNVYILAKRKIVPCNWCKVKKYNFDMIRRVMSSGQVLMMCSLNCMTLYQVSINAVSSRRIKCDMCMSVAQAQYHLTMSDATIRNFCTYPCVMNFQQQYSKSPITLPGSDAAPIPTGGPVPVISSVTSLTNGQPTSMGAKKASGKLSLVTRLIEPTMCRNKNTQTRPIMMTKSVSCRPHSVSIGVQTEECKKETVLIPVPVPIYVPCPMAMYSFPFPVPVPFPLPVPVPMFLPTTRNSIKGIMKEIKRIQEKVPTDPFQAEVLMMAEMVATDKKEEETSSDSEADNEPAADSRPNSDEEGDFNSESIETGNTFGDDIMQIALKMATELDEPSEDLETQLPPATILNQPQSENNEEKSNGVEVPKKPSSAENRGRKRQLPKSQQKKNTSSDTKRKKVNHNSDVTPTTPTSHVEEPKPDANMKLKYTFGVNAWKSWVNQKNAEIEKLNCSNKKLKPLKTDILQLNIDELNFSLSMFVKEVQKPNGTQYAPDTIYYLCLGIQQYLYENGRIDNIFTDSYFESFTDALDEIAKKFAELFNDHHYIVTRVEEEHLWESKQLGAHSPHVLLSTLMFFNTKYFNLTNVDEHMMLSFSHIMKHWKRNSNQSSTTVGSGKAPGSRNVLLRFYPPQAVVDDPNSKKKKVYEQQENEENPLKCPVKLYEFYMSKCPESVKTRSDVFYLQPERSCVPDSPVWYSTMALGKEPLEKMLNRVKMVKEINIALLTP